MYTQNRLAFFFSDTTICVFEEIQPREIDHMKSMNYSSVPSTLTSWFDFNSQKNRSLPNEFYIEKHVFLKKPTVVDYIV